MELASETGMGCVFMAHTNHWMRGGTYGWMAARKGFAFIAWTNTIANMPPWGAATPKLGNNPIVLAVPFEDEAIVLDMAMSQYSFGALELHQLKKQRLPVPGGFNSGGETTTDPAEILASRRVLPIGYWKGAGLSLLLDILATILSGGLAVHEISHQPGESSLSQVFVAIDLRHLQNYHGIANALEQIVADYKQVPGNEGRIVYPGERVLAIRKENTLKGIPVFRKTWEELNVLT
jgi:3-dehydro-L-gulonate 2-dehydrogenase